MAKYTIELKDIVCDRNIFDFKYPFYNEKKRAEFEQKFIRHFYFREIGCQTVDRFLFYLEEKMLTVFPHYNKLFEASEIEYDVLDNYKLTETYERNIESEGKSSGINSTVGQIFDKQETETNQNRTVDTEGETSQNENDVSTTSKNETVENDTTSTQQVDGTSTKETEGSTNTTGNTKKKFIDTPQGLTDLTDSRYLTNLTEDDTTGSQETEGTETGSNNQTTEAEGNSTTTTNGTSETEGERNQTSTSQGNETTVDNVKGSSSQEQKTTQDNNTRQYTHGNQKETYTINRRGNVGVDTDSDAIEKHIRLQKVFAQIERNFFDECEDLFMLVF